MSYPMPDTSKAAIGKRLIAVRTARGYLQSTVVQLLKTSQQRWSLYETGQRDIPFDLLYKFCRTTGATTDFVLYDDVAAMPRDLIDALRETGYDFGGASDGSRAG